MAEHYVRAELVRPKRPWPELLGEGLGQTAVLAFHVFIIWWFMASWFPEMGITYWQAILPVYAARMFFVQPPPGRQLTTR